MNEKVLVNSPEVSVSELSANLKRTLEDAYDHVRVRGELGKVSYHSNGHVYFDLKDDRACIASVIWRSSAGRLKIKLETGLEVIATGKITTYAGRSQYQLIVDRIEPAGIGALLAQLEERKKKLAAEGLFDPARKQIIPFLPRVIGVVTSPTGAVIRDILHRLEDRFPRHVVVWPVRVQGDGSAAEVANAIRGFNALAPGGRIARPDLIIVARGGGSLEDLWSFNEEIVARAAAESDIPLISAVGHETDTTLIDFASDRRAPTPTAAAEMAVPVRSELLAQISNLGRRSFASWTQRQERRRADLRGITRALPGPDRLLGERRQALDVAAQRLLRGLRAGTHTHGVRFHRVEARLAAQSPREQMRRLRKSVADWRTRFDQIGARLMLRPRERFAGLSERLKVGLVANRTAHATKIARDRQTLNALHSRLGPAWDVGQDRRIAAIDRAESLLAALSYHGVLERGFALVRDADGKPVHSAKTVDPAMRLDIEFADGRVVATAGEVAQAEPPKPRRRRRQAVNENQGTLF
ncbi:exodeoxyribonuclease 7 large subunit [Variibacter gotjawalensis]|uniref:Exodeoxyribonuclease 7 large subunit n=1 Tax=Variibacter gotjawalensis TaxID=1333996 RepID=A0A0S3PPJ7_9BRAD|nr:exodeoxyribonuclease VII large subunit [Variibacter gotjawalensis]NIK48158.1 exodeoxyribonuclease VII large subunit [Variibacter gotjawalensis]RZS50030.1 exodeoxyribonuclease VII large subunit [Variibacter gotjawalensis]BAT57861.1 exodeoxyribonuclease 7 large subunit [Variibacter gotjawalensis]